MYKIMHASVPPNTSENFLNIFKSLQMEMQLRMSSKCTLMCIVQLFYGSLTLFSDVAIGWTLGHWDLADKMKTLQGPFLKHNNS